MRKIALLLVLVAFAGPGAAQTQLDVGPGLVGPSSPVYGLEVAWDNAAMGFGLAKPGTIAQERAAEARAALKRNNTEAMQEAVRQMSRVAKRARSGDAQGLQKAQAVLNQVMQRAPEQAQQGLRTAMNNIQQAMQRIPEGAGPGGGTPGAGGQTGQAGPGPGGTGGQAGTVTGGSGNRTGDQGGKSGGIGGSDTGGQSPSAPTQNRP